MPFSILIALATLTKTIRLLLEPMQENGLSNFMDDMLVATETFTEHITYQSVEKTVCQIMRVQSDIEVFCGFS